MLSQGRSHWAENRRLTGLKSGEEGWGQGSGTAENTMGETGINMEGDVEGKEEGRERRDQSVGRKDKLLSVLL